MQSKLPNDWKSQLIFVFILLLTGALFVSRATLSICLGLLLAASVFLGNIKHQLKKFVAAPLLWGMAILLFIPLISWFWSEDQQAWLKVVQVKLPLLVLPLAFAGTWQLNQRQWMGVAAFFLCVVAAGTMWSLFQYLVDSHALQQAYLKAKTIPVPLEGDYVRFSWLVGVAIIVALMISEMDLEKKWKIVLWLLAIWFILYLHLLAARTGLFAADLFLLAWGMYKLIKAKNRLLPVILLASVLVLPVVAWLLFPTFQNRLKYLRYNFDFVKNSSYLPGATDGNRVFSIKAGWDVVKNNPLGVGAGDLGNAARDWYQREVPGMLEADMIYPSNEWLIYGGFAGWPAIILFSFVMALPFIYKNIRQRFYWYGFHAVSIFSFLVDSGLEVQFGVFLYGFITCCWWKWSQSQKQQLI